MIKNKPGRETGIPLPCFSTGLREFKLLWNCLNRFTCFGVNICLELDLYVQSLAMLFHHEFVVLDFGLNVVQVAKVFVDLVAEGHHFFSYIFQSHAMFVTVSMLMLTPFGFCCYCRQYDSPDHNDSSK